MADSNGSVSSWPGFVDQLNKTFMLVRDAFGYALPGAAFLAVGIVSHSFSLCEVYCLLLPYHMPPWMAFLAVVAVSYAVGGVMAAAAYMPFMLAKTAVWWLYRRPPETISSPPTPAEIRRATRTAWLVKHPTEVTKEILDIRINYPKLIDTLDRRETLCLLAASMSSALLYGWLVFYYLKLHFGTIILCGGVVTYIQFLTGLPHLRRVAEATRQVELEDPPKKDPDFRQLLADLITAGTAALRKIAP
ncbi:MAG TPA: hypothetical protein VNX26_14090 [Candidatus Acidoferrum sp.]|jgi:hypothetical protein|nr:hypothetical protein [Candidatus Acidoferrum sp.]